MKKLKVMTVVGTRPEIIRLSRVINLLDKCCEHLLVHTGQNYDAELNNIFFFFLYIPRPNFCTESAGKNAAQTIGNIIPAIDDLLEKVKPDAFLVLGDTNSCLAAIAAKRRKIPIFHMEAGNRCFDFRVPEEINRRIVDHISDINLTYSAIAREYLLREGLPPDQIIRIGSPMLEVLNYSKIKINRSKILKSLSLTEKNFILVSIHREENILPDTNFKKIVDILNTICKKFELELIMTTHPRTKNRLMETEFELDDLVRLLKPLSFTDYVKLQMSAKFVISDSGTISEEASILGFPALNLRESHERPEAMEEGAVMMCGLSVERVLQCLEVLNSSSVRIAPNRKVVADYNVKNVSEKVVRIIHSYTGYIDQKVWKKDC